MKKHNLLVLILSFSLLIVLALSICIGSVPIKLIDVYKCLFDSSEVSSSTSYIIKNMRIPRTLTAVFCGIILALSGMIFQCIFRNPMADSYILGISSGASCMVALVFSLGINLTNTYVLPIAAFTGAVSTSIFILLSNRKDSMGLLLTGVATNFLLSASTTLFVYLGKRQLDAVMFWTMGNLSNANWIKVIALFTTVVIFYLYTIKNNKTFDVLLLDDSTAISSGLNITRKRIELLVVSSACTAIVVSYCGVIGFIGLMSPHISRLIIGPTHKKLIPTSSLIGALILLISDLVSRTIISPTELPVGIITSILGAPLFFIVLKRRKSWVK